MGAPGNSGASRAREAKGAPVVMVVDVGEISCFCQQVISTQLKYHDSGLPRRAVGIDPKQREPRVRLNSRR